MKLLSILRSPDQLTALHRAGADGIILGIKGLSYRIPTYSIDQAMDILQNATLLKMDVFLSLNRLLDEDEIQSAKIFIESLQPKSFTGIYFQDLAYVTLCEGKDLQLIYAPEAIITNSKEVEALCACGIDRIMAAKELTLDEISTMSVNNPQKIELFGFGHLPMALSRRPLVRNYLEEIQSDPSLSEGTQIRLKEEKRTVFYPILEEDKETTLFSDTIFSALSELKRLDKCGIYSMIADDVFVDAQLLATFIASCKRILDGGDAQREAEQLALSAPEFTFSNGYFEKKTNSTKEGASL